MLAHPDELSEMGQILHTKGMECTTRNKREEAHCYQTIAVTVKKLNDQGYLKDLPIDSFLHIDECDT